MNDFEDGWAAAIAAARDAIQNDHGLDERWWISGPHGAYSAKRAAIEAVESLTMPLRSDVDRG